MSAFGAVILGCAGTALSNAELSLYSGMRPFGFILFNRNLQDADQIRALCDSLRAAASHNAPIFIDQEGGRVQRLRPPLARDWPAPLEDATAPDAERRFYLRARLIADELRGLGIDGNCIPTLDIARADTHAVLRNRCYGTDGDTVIRHGRAVVQGCLDGGVLPVMKHMPGHGLGTLDSHLDLPRVTTDRAILDRQDFAVFKAFADLPLAMTAHLVFEDIDPRPATLSPVMNRVMRDQIGFDGLLMTDDISMQALTGSVAERGVAARSAGCDVVLHCNGDLAEMQALCDAVGAMDAPAQARAERALQARATPKPVDIAALRAEADAFAALDPHTDPA
ncbi:glycoside hydrolase family 3 N-terminal domain-containing protein [Antarctobacter heliothermus]|uniref:beta-N-acetylhexosaminidase n=1 Tax=Antarctobacter heliothermus TaxID=74033 RepID=A0A239EMA5_9RHOB|nr:glycoside hydrolase family 3 N-terminal domain-containing protein [Antarctobacter heliothermus]SNS45531.1 beta-N-acetylhexosaminidase [Antarctobacter heliothermus]